MNRLRLLFGIRFKGSLANGGQVLPFLLSAERGPSWEDTTSKRANSQSPLSPKLSKERRQPARARFGERGGG